MKLPSLNIPAVIKAVRSDPILCLLAIALTLVVFPISIAAVRGHGSVAEPAYGIVTAIVAFLIIASAANRFLGIANSVSSSNGAKKIAQRFSAGNSVHPGKG